MAVYVKDGDFSKALKEFKQSVKRAGILKDYQASQNFRPKRERRKTRKKPNTQVL